MTESPSPYDAAPAATGGRRPVVIALAVAVVLALLGGGSALAWPLLFPGTAGASDGEVFLESAVAAGRDPFTGDVVVGNPPGVKSQTQLASSGTGGGTPTIAGDTPALYGGSRNEKLCDKQKLIDFLAQNPDKAAAWAGVLDIAPSQVAEYVGKLTPTQLRADTRVTNHGYVNGKATPRQAVLQAGTAVMADELGRPRVKCGCGNPLADPVALTTAPRPVGDPWPGYTQRGVVAITPATRPIEKFLLIDLRTDESFYRLIGSNGDADVPVVPPTPTTTVAPPTTPAPTIPPPVRPKPTTRAPAPKTTTVAPDPGSGPVEEPQPQPPPKPVRHASVSLSPTSGPPGTVIHFSGHDFQGSTIISISQSGAGGNRSVGTVTPNSDGDFEVSIGVESSATPGRRNITFHRSDVSVTVYFDVTGGTAG